MDSNWLNQCQWWNTPGQARLQQSLPGTLANEQQYLQQSNLYRAAQNSWGPALPPPIAYSAHAVMWQSKPGEILHHDVYGASG